MAVHEKTHEKTPILRKNIPNYQHFGPYLVYEWIDIQQFGS